MKDIETFAHDIFNAQPFSQFMGAKLTSIGTKEAELTLPITDHLKPQHGFVHGGAIS